jgi:hypothetical protein
MPIGYIYERLPTHNGCVVIPSILFPSTTLFSNFSLTMILAWGILKGWANNVLSFIWNLEIVIHASASHAPGKWFLS